MTPRQKGIENRKLVLQALSKRRLTFSDLMSITHLRNQSLWTNLRNLQSDSLITSIKRGKDKRAHYELTAYGRHFYEQIVWPLVETLSKMENTLNPALLTVEFGSALRLESIYDEPAFRSGVFDMFPSMNEMADQFRSHFLLSSFLRERDHTDRKIKNGTAVVGLVTDVTRLYAWLDEFTSLVNSAPKTDFFLDRNYRLANARHPKNRRKVLIEYLEMVRIGQRTCFMALSMDAFRPEIVKRLGKLLTSCEHTNRELLRQTVIHADSVLRDLNPDDLDVIIEDIEEGRPVEEDKRIRVRLATQEYVKERGNRFVFPLFDYLTACAIKRPLDIDFLQKVDREKERLTSIILSTDYLRFAKPGFKL